MLRYHVAYYLPRGDDRMMVAEVLDFPGVCSQGFDLADARVMIASALEEMAQRVLVGYLSLSTQFKRLLVSFFGRICAD